MTWTIFQFLLPAIVATLAAGALLSWLIATPHDAANVARKRA